MFKNCISQELYKCCDEDAVYCKSVVTKGQCRSSSDMLLLCPPPSDHSLMPKGIKCMRTITTCSVSVCSMYGVAMCVYYTPSLTQRQCKNLNMAEPINIFRRLSCSQNQCNISLSAPNWGRVNTDAIISWRSQWARAFCTGPYNFTWKATNYFSPWRFPPR